MTMTEARPEADAATAGARPSAEAILAARAEAAGADAIIDTSDHRRVGLVFVVAALLGYLGVRGIGTALGIELLQQGVDIVGDDSRRLYSLADTGIFLLFLAPIWIGLSTAIVPLQLGATRLAFPRVQSLALWLHVLGAALWIAGQLIDPLPGLGLASTDPLRAPLGGVQEGTDLVLASLVLLGLASLLAAGNLVTTCLTRRADGMTLLRMPLFSWATLATGAATLLATPVFLAGVALLYLDLHFGGTSLFAADGAEVLWQKALWLYGRPEVFLVVLPALGAAGDIVLTAARRPVLPLKAPVPGGLAAKLPPAPGVATPLKGHVVAAGALFAFAILSFATWTAKPEAMRSLVQPASTPGTALVLAPLGLFVLLLLGTLATNKAKPTFGVAFVLGFLLLVAAAVAVSIWNLVDTEGTGSLAATAGVELGIIGASTLLAFGAIHHWAKKLAGRPLSTPAAGLALLAVLGGSLALGLGNALAGHAGAAANLKDYTDGDLQAGFTLALLGQLLLLVGGLVLLLDLLRALAASRGGALEADHADGVTLEWATSSPPPVGNFTLVPEVRSETPLLDLDGDRRTTKTEKGA